jgi:hypothetical protein
MFASTVVAMTEASLLSVEASRIAALHLQVLLLGGAAAWDQADLMAREKAQTLSQTFLDLVCASHPER